MATKQTLAVGIVDIVVTGIKGLKAQLTQLQAQLKRVGEQAGKIGTGAAKGFTAMAGAITGTLTAADPMRFKEFGVALQVLSLHIGRTFIPLLVDATAAVNRLIKVFKDLTPEQRETILNWTKLALSITAAVAVGGKLLSWLPMVTGLLGKLGAVMSVVKVAAVGMVSTLGGPLTIALAAVAALGGGLVYFGSRSAKVTELAGKAFQRLQETAVVVFEKLKAAVAGATTAAGPMLERLGAWFEGVASRGLEAFIAFLPTVVSTVDRVIAFLGPALTSIGNWFSEMSAKAVAAFEVIAPVVMSALETAWTYAQPILEQMKAAFVSVAADVVAAFAIIGPAVTSSVQSIGAIFRAVMPYVTGLVGGLLAGLSKMKPVVEIAFNALLIAIKGAIRGFTFLASLIKKALKGEFSTMLDDAFAADKEFERRAEESKKSIEESLKPDSSETLSVMPSAVEQLPAPKEVGGGSASAKPASKVDPNKYNPKLMAQTPALMAITEASKKVQTSQQMDPALRYAKELAEASRDNGKTLDQIAANTEASAVSFGLAR